MKQAHILPLYCLLVAHVLKRVFDIQSLKTQQRYPTDTMSKAAAHYTCIRRSFVYEYNQVHSVSFSIRWHTCCNQANRGICGANTTKTFSIKPTRIYFQSHHRSCEVVANCWSVRASKVAKDKAHKQRHKYTFSAINYCVIIRFRRINTWMFSFTMRKNNLFWFDASYNATIQ